MDAVKDLGIKVPRPINKPMKINLDPVLSQITSNTFFLPYSVGEG